jgi:hypothetical protein
MVAQLVEENPTDPHQLALHDLRHLHRDQRRQVLWR